MTLSLAETLTEAAQAAVRAGDWERDQEAWNLPRRSAEPDSCAAGPGGLDWERFLAAYFPGSRRHDLRAITAYAAYKRSRGVDEEPVTETARLNEVERIGPTSVEDWEDEGGAAR